MAGSYEKPPENPDALQLDLSSAGSTELPAWISHIGEPVTPETQVEYQNGFPLTIRPDLGTDERTGMVDETVIGGTVNSSLFVTGDEAPTKDVALSPSEHYRRKIRPRVVSSDQHWPSVLSDGEDTAHNRLVEMGQASGLPGRPSDVPTDLTFGQKSAPYNYLNEPGPVHGEDSSPGDQVARQEPVKLTDQDVAIGNEGLRRSGHVPKTERIRRKMAEDHKRDHETPLF